MSEEHSESVEAVQEGVTETVSTETESQKEFSREDVVSREDFKKMQATLDKQVARERAERQKIEQQLREASLASVPEEQREFVKVQQELEAAREQLASFQRLNALRDLSSQYNVPFEILQDADTPQAAFATALDYVSRRNASSSATGNSQADPVAPPQAKKETPFVAPQQAGSNKARDWDAEFQAAMDAGDTHRYATLLREQKQASAS